ncbi:MAG: hypothetical protein ACKO1J_07650 [Tagaea sp.]
MRPILPALAFLPPLAGCAFLGVPDGPALTASELQVARASCQAQAESQSRTLSGESGPEWVKKEDRNGNVRLVLGYAFTSPRDRAYRSYFNDCLRSWR